MIVVAVRNVETKKFLGFFWAPTHDGLWWAIDAVTEPSAYEWAPLGDGGVHYEDDDERDMTEFLGSDDDGDSPEEEHELVLNGLQLHEYNWAELDDDSKWTRFDYAAEGHGGVASLLREVAKKREAASRPKEPK